MALLVTGLTVMMMMVVLMGEVDAALMAMRETPPTSPATHTLTVMDPPHYSLYQRVDVMSLDQLVMFAGMVQPYSCWCANSDNSCPVHIPAIPLHRVLKVTCGYLNIHCCLERVKAKSKEDWPFAAANITTSQELEIFFDSLIDILKPQEILLNNTLGDSEVLNQGASHNPIYPSSQQIKNNIFSEEYDIQGKPDNDSVKKRQVDVFELVLLLTLKGVAEYMMTLTAQPRMITPSFGDNSPPSFHDNEVQVQLDEYNFPSSTTNNVISSTQKNPLTNTDIYSVSNDLSVKGDFVVPYSNLGWFSRVVEVAMDGSVYVGLLLTVMFFAAKILTGALSIFGETCLICTIIGYVNETGIS
ncbi:uncharacterized protein LOC121868247 isoform X1 [Homarus americanus]|uniref:Uncharacterized protein n=1 Tax=Homarus americanus TaxID=6706 RepID=A0A8J5NCA0_HOMAM|nr:uncharacterized protein LOC121868247 isoform X1 [Homarus americanus]KAG7177057.1 hypothetical protein Hamer_G000283 [Homarus americanus]